MTKPEKPDYFTDREGVRYEVLDLDADPGCDCDCHLGLARGAAQAPAKCIKCLIDCGAIRVVDWVGRTSK